MTRDGNGHQDLLNHWLSSLGYRVAFRLDAWVECLVWREGERWIGRGADRMEAFADAFERMLPSHAARELLTAFLATQRAEAAATASEPPAPERAPEPPAPRVPTIPRIVAFAEDDPVRAAATSSARTEPAQPTHSQGASGLHPDDSAPDDRAPDDSVPDSDASGEDTSDSATQDRETGAATIRAVPSGGARESGADEGASEEGSDGEAGAPIVVLPPPMDPDEALSEVSLLSDLIEGNRPELALMTPERQRLMILSWICHARAIQAASGGHSRVVSAVTSIARRLTLFSKMWWPGSVMALQIDATPNDVGRELELARNERPRGWADAAEAAENRLRDVEARDEVDGRDEYGWADGGFLQPKPLQPAEKMIELRRHIENAAGPVDQKPPQRAPDGVRRPTLERKKQLLKWARRVRWLRGHTTEFLLWGHLMGRLRWMAAQADQRDDTLLQILDPAFHPRHSWATELGQDPDAKRKKRLKKQVLQNRPGVGADSAGRNAVITWLGDAFGVLEAPRIAKLLAPFKDTVLSLDEAELPESNRAMRRRLRAIQKHLLTGESLPEDIDTPQPGDEQEDPVEPAPEEPAADYVDDDPSDPAMVLLSRILPQTRGRRALFVSNRTDPELQESIRETFEFESLDWCEGSPRRVQTVASRVAGGAYDIVLGATGFQSHSMDTHLIRACRRANVRYVRVHRGRPLACTLALARELGISTDQVAAQAV